MENDLWTTVRCKYDFEIRNIINKLCFLEESLADDHNL